MTILRIIKPVESYNHSEATSNKTSNKSDSRQHSQAGQDEIAATKSISPDESLRRQVGGAQTPKGILNKDFDFAPMPHSEYPFLEPFRDILVSLKLSQPRGVNPLAWRILDDVKRTGHPDQVALKTGQGDPVGLQLLGPLASVSAVHLMSQSGFILDSATKLDDGTWVFSKARDGYERNVQILLQTEAGSGAVRNESLPLRSLKGS